MQLHFLDYAHYSLLDVVLHLINKGPSRTQLLSQLYTCPERKKRCWGRGAWRGEKCWCIILTSCHADQSSNETLEQWENNYYGLDLSPQWTFCHTPKALHNRTPFHLMCRPQSEESLIWRHGVWKTVI